MLAIQKRLSAPFMALLALPATAMGFALSIQIAALSWILRTKYELDIHEIGLVWAAGPLAGILGQVIIGVISDKVWFWNGRRRPFIVIGGVIASLMLLALPNIDIISDSLGFDGIIGVAIAIALTLDLAVNVSFNPTRAIIADVTPEGKARTRGYGWMQTISGTFGMAAYFIGAIWDNYLLIYLGAVVVLLFSILPPFFITEPKEIESEEAESGKLDILAALMSIKPLWALLAYGFFGIFAKLAGLEFDHNWIEIGAIAISIALIADTLRTDETKLDADAARDAGFRKVLAAHSFSWIAIQSMFVFMFAFLEGKIIGLDADGLGLVQNISFGVLNGVGALLPALVLTPLANRIGRIKTHTLALIVSAIAYACLPLFGNTELGIYILIGFVGVGWASIISLSFAIMSQKVKGAQMGLYMGLFNLSVVLPQLFVSLGVGIFLSRLDDKTMIFYICAAAMAVSAIAWTRVKEDRDTPEPLDTHDTAQH